MMIDKEKAKAYDEALKRAKEIKSKILSSHLSTESCKAVSEYIDTIIPELAESEDERIRKSIILLLQRGGYMSPEDKEEAYAWLEKLKEYANDLSLEQEAYLTSERFKQAEKEKDEFTTRKFLQCLTSFGDFKEGAHYWLEYIGGDKYVGRSDNVLGEVFHITPRQLFTLFSDKLEEAQEPPQEEKQVPLNYEPPFDENPSDKEIIEALIKHLKEEDGFLTAIDCVSIKAILSWLKKQKEQKSSEYEKSLLSKFEQAVYDCAWDKVTCKPEGETREEYAKRWAEQLLLMVRDWADNYIDSQIVSTKHKAYDKGKADAEKPAEWSEENEKRPEEGLLDEEKMITGIIDGITNLASPDNFGDSITFGGFNWKDCVIFLKKLIIDETKRYTFADLQESYKRGHLKGEEVGREKMMIEIQRDHEGEEWINPDDFTAHIRQAYQDGFREGVESVKPAEWSEEDEDAINGAIGILLDDNKPNFVFSEHSKLSVGEIVKRLKSLCSKKNISYGELPLVSVDHMEGLDTDFEKQVGAVIASAMNREHQFTSEYVKWTAQQLMECVADDKEWSEEDKIRLDSIISSYRELLQDYKECHGVDYIPDTSNTLIHNVADDVDFLKSLISSKDCSSCAKHLEGYISGRCDAENKLLEQFGALITPEDELHIKSRWKPSEEQMKALDSAISYLTEHTCTPGNSLLVSLFNALQKLS